MEDVMISSFCMTKFNYTQASGQRKQSLHSGGELYCIILILHIHHYYLFVPIQEDLRIKNYAGDKKVKTAVNK